jgi:hypothetical protein
MHKSKSPEEETKSQLIDDEHLPPKDKSGGDPENSPEDVSFSHHANFILPPHRPVPFPASQIHQSLISSKVRVDLDNDKNFYVCIPSYQ